MRHQTYSRHQPVTHCHPSPQSVTHCTYHRMCNVFVCMCVQAHVSSCVTSSCVCSSPLSHRCLHRHRFHLQKSAHQKALYKTQTVRKVPLLFCKDCRKSCFQNTWGCFRNKLRNSAQTLQKSPVASEKCTLYSGKKLRTFWKEACIVACPIFRIHRDLDRVYRVFFGDA